jgi:hypothetical protein
MKNSILTIVSNTIDTLYLQLSERDMEILKLKMQLKDAEKHIEKLEKR